MKPRMGIYVWTILLVGVLAFGAACSKVAGDTEVTSEVQSRLNADSGLQGKQLTVQTSGGVVTLSGTVDNDAQRTAASRYASSVSGVKEVVNDIQVADIQVAPAAAEMTPDQPAPAEPPRRSAKPRPSTPRQRPASSSSEMASAAPPPSIAPVQESRPAPAQTASPATPAPLPPPKRVTIPSGTNLP